MKTEYETLTNTYSQYQKTLAEINKLDKKIIELEGAEEIEAAAREIMKLREQIKILDEQSHILKKRLASKRDDLQQAIGKASLQDKENQSNYTRSLHEAAHKLLKSDVVDQYKTHVLAAAELLRMAGVSEPLETAQNETYIETVDYRNMPYTPGENPLQREEEAKRFNTRYHQQRDEMTVALKNMGGPPKRPTIPKILGDAERIISEVNYWLEDSK